MKKILALILISIILNIQNTFAWGIWYAIKSEKIFSLLNYFEKEFNKLKLTKSIWKNNINCEKEHLKRLDSLPEQELNKLYYSHWTISNDIFTWDYTWDYGFNYFIKDDKLIYIEPKNYLNYKNNDFNNNKRKKYRVVINDSISNFYNTYGDWEFPIRYLRKMWNDIYYIAEDWKYIYIMKNNKVFKNIKKVYNFFKESEEQFPWILYDESGNIYKDKWTYINWWDYIIDKNGKKLYSLNFLRKQRWKIEEELTNIYKKYNALHKNNIINKFEEQEKLIEKMWNKEDLFFVKKKENWNKVIMPWKKVLSEKYKNNFPYVWMSYFPNLKKYNYITCTKVYGCVEKIL